MRSLKKLWATFDIGDHLTDGDLARLIENVDKGIEFLEARGETGGVLYKARLNRASLVSYQDARRRNL
jgi:hypothetical protein